MSAIPKLTLWGMLNGIIAAIVFASGNRPLFVAYVVMSAWWLAGNIVYELRRKE